MPRSAQNLNKAEASTSGRPLFKEEDLKFEWTSIKDGRPVNLLDARNDRRQIHLSTSELDSLDHFNIMSSLGSKSILSLIRGAEFTH